MKVITSPNTRWSYANIWEPQSINDGLPKCSVFLIILKFDTKTIAQIKTVIEAAYKAGKSKLKGNDKSEPALSVIKTSLHDREDAPAYVNSYLVNVNATSASGIVDINRDLILILSQVYSGVYGRASVTFYTLNSSGNKSIACGFNNLYKVSYGEPLGDKSSAESAFDTDDNDDFLDLRR